MFHVQYWQQFLGSLESSGKGNSRRILGDVEAFLDGEKGVLEGLQALGLFALTALENVRHVLETTKIAKKRPKNTFKPLHVESCFIPELALRIK
jgi:hypothetical protein